MTQQDSNTATDPTDSSDVDQTASEVEVRDTTSASVSIWDSINPPVFLISGGLLILLLMFSVFFPGDAVQFFKGLKASILNTFGWFYILSVVILFGFAMWLSVSPYGELRLGPDGSEPEYNRASWYAMLFAAGMGIGLVFYGVAEPLAHFRSPPVGAKEGSEALAHALPLTFHHWGLHAWALYAVIGLSIAFFTYRRGPPLALRSCFYPVFGERIHGWIGISSTSARSLGLSLGSRPRSEQARPQ